MSKKLAEEIVKTILADLSDRKGVLEGVDNDTMTELQDDLEHAVSQHLDETKEAGPILKKLAAALDKEAGKKKPGTLRDFVAKSAAYNSASVWAFKVSK